MKTASPSETVATSAKEVLIAAKWILENVGWCQSASMRDKEGRILDVYHSSEMKNAAAFCASGAIIAVRVSDRKLVYDAYDALNQASESKLHFVQWNDALGRTKKQVLDLFDRAIKKCK